MPEKAKREFTRGAQFAPITAIQDTPGFDKSTRHQKCKVERNFLENLDKFLQYYLLSALYFHFHFPVIYTQFAFLYFIQYSSSAVS